MGAKLYLYTDFINSSAWVASAAAYRALPNYKATERRPIRTASGDDIEAPAGYVKMGPLANDGAVRAGTEKRERRTRIGSPNLYGIGMAILMESMTGFDDAWDKERESGEFSK